VAQTYPHSFDLTRRSQGKIAQELLLRGGERPNSCAASSLQTFPETALNSERFPESDAR